MTNEEAREILEKLIPQPQRGDGKSITHLMITEALTMAIKALEQKPNEQIMKLQTYKMFEGEDTVYVERDDVLKVLEQEPCDDCISREAVIDIINFEDEWLFDANSHNADTKIAFSTIKSKISEMPSVTPKASEQQPSREWKEIYAESEGSNSWIEFKCPHCGCSFGMESGEYDWHYGDEIPWKYCPICGGSAEHKPYKTESEETE